jgi:hypothetical protein
MVKYKIDVLGVGVGRIVMGCFIMGRIIMGRFDPWDVMWQQQIKTYIAWEMSLEHTVSWNALQ